MQREGQRAWSALNTAFASGKMPTGELADAALILVGGLLLMLPGFITDIFGFVFLLPVHPPVRPPRPRLRRRPPRRPDGRGRRP